MLKLNTLDLYGYNSVFENELTNARRTIRKSLLIWVSWLYLVKTLEQFEDLANKQISY